MNLNLIDFSPDYCRMSRLPPLASPENEHEDDFGKMHTVCMKLSNVGNVLSQGCFGLNFKDSAEPKSNP